MMSELVRETPLTPFEEMEARYRLRELPERLNEGENLYGQLPFGQVLKGIMEESGEDLNNLRHFLTYITLTISKKYGGIPEEIDVQGKRRSVFLPLSMKTGFGEKIIKGKVAERRKMALAILEALDQYPEWMTYVSLHTISSGSYYDVYGDFKKDVSGAGPAKNYIAWITGRKVRGDSIERREIRQSFGEKG